ncbi:MAG: SpoVR family protein [Deltaproteobacteria bacterium]|nr:SpoVR family protein [Deltaproteobacteria bacterium]
MELIDQHTKKIMEDCKERARTAGLRFQDESLEYIVTNRDLLEISPKVMIPTLYDYWVHDVEVLREKGKYELYQGNPYETVINTRPAISFYNDNNPDWLNVMIFYHVLGHIDFFQNNIYFQHTWDYDFTGQALSDKRVIARLRSEKNKWVDYVIEFARGIDNLVGFHDTLSRKNHVNLDRQSKKLNFYFDIFLQSVIKARINVYVQEIERYNRCIDENGALGQDIFFSEIEKKHPEFATLFQKSLLKKPGGRKDLIQFLLEHSDFLNKEENRWMKTVIQVVRKTSLFFQPQIRTKIMNEGWASYWHEQLFLKDERIKGHEVEFARVNAAVTSLPRVGLNPYALGMRLFFEIEEMADKGRYDYEFQRLLDTEARKKFNADTKQGRALIFAVRENYCDSMFISTFLNQEFINRYNLFVAGKRLNKRKMVWEYYIKSRNVLDYQKMIQDSLYHPPHITVKNNGSGKGELYLVHHFEGKPLVNEFIANTMMGIEYLWGKPVKLETSVVASQPGPQPDASAAGISSLMPGAKGMPEIVWRRVVYTMDNRKLSKSEI